MTRCCGVRGSRKTGRCNSRRTTLDSPVVNGARSLSHALMPARVWIRPNRPAINRMPVPTKPMRLQVALAQTLQQGAYRGDCRFSFGACDRPPLPSTQFPHFQRVDSPEPVLEF